MLKLYNMQYSYKMLCKLLTCFLVRWSMNLKEQNVLSPLCVTGDWRCDELIKCQLLLISNHEASPLLGPGPPDPCQYLHPPSSMLQYSIIFFWLKTDMLPITISTFT